MRDHVLITGGCGFVGTNLAERLLREGQPVMVLDDMSRAGVERNLEWLRAGHGDLLRVELADIRDPKAVRRAVRRARAVFHFAAQVAVTTSLSQPMADFMVNGLGTMNLLEALRAIPAPPPLFFTSTNKVYGALEDVALEQCATRYAPIHDELREFGVSEHRPLEFHSPYGCSKGTADQYVLDYARTFGMPTTVFRMSCIYGPRQFGTEDQGWVAHFLIRALEGRPITLYGDGKQVRDILFVDDLVDAFLAAWRCIDRVKGQVFNVGGGPSSTTSLLELLDRLESVHGIRTQARFESWREADQRWYVSDTRKLQAVTGWAPAVGIDEGLRRLHSWLSVARRSRSWRSGATTVAVDETEAASP
jgi:CDP-paratose 2-epimerase